MALTGIIWLVVNLMLQSEVPSVCIMRNLTAVPCPTCGVTDSIVMLLNGDLMSSLRINAAGPVIFLMILSGAAFLTRNILIGKRSVSDMINTLESHVIRRELLVYTFLGFLFINWLVILYQHFIS